MCQAALAAGTATVASGGGLISTGKAAGAGAPAYVSLALSDPEAEQLLGLDPKTLMYSPAVTDVASPAPVPAP